MHTHLAALRPLGLFAVICASNVSAQHTVSLPADLADPGTQVEDVHVGLNYSEGPAVDLQGNVYFSEDPDYATGRIWKITPEGTKSAYKDPARGANGLEFDNEGRLHIAMFDSVLRVETDGKITVMAAKGSLTLGKVNDLSVASTGAMFFTNLNGNTIFFRGVDGQIKTRSQTFCNGIEWIEEKSTIYIGGNELQKCKVVNATGEISNCAKFTGTTDGLTFDEQGNLYRASWQEGRIFVHDSTGQQRGYIAIASKDVAGKHFTAGNTGNATNCLFGGPDRKTLFITGDGGLYKVKLKVPGRLRPGHPGHSTIIRSEARLARPVYGPARAALRLFDAAGALVFSVPAGGYADLKGRAVLP
jgi:gluconolactonase